MTVIEQLKFRFPRAAAAVEPRLAFLRKAISFGLVGVVNSLLDLVLFSIGQFLFGWPTLVANTVSWIIAVSFSYVMNSKFTFAAESGRRLTWRAYTTFVLSGIFGFLANTATLFAVAKYVAPIFIANHSLQITAGKIVAILASFVVNFSLSHFVVFRRRAET
jgi:putative flippase GtrA